VANGCEARFLDHHDAGCRRCQCKTPQHMIMGNIATTPNSTKNSDLIAKTVCTLLMRLHTFSGMAFAVRIKNLAQKDRSMKLSDTRRGSNRLQRFYARHKTFAKAFVEFGIIWFTITSTFLAFAAGKIDSDPAVPDWLPFLLIFYSPFFAYLVGNWSKSAIRKELLEKIDMLSKRIDEVHGK
jgi:hypothetical protein